MTTTAFDIEAKLTQNFQPSSTKQIKYETKSLSNGTKAISRNAWTESVSFSIAVNSGSKYETAKEKGAAHLLAAAGFSGTQSRSGLRLLRDIENAGFIVDVNADREQIVYTIKGLPDAADAALETLAEAVFSPPIRDYIINERKPTAALQIERNRRCPFQSISRLIYEAAYGEASSLGSSPYALNLDDLSAADVLAFRQRNFTAPNVTIIANGVSVDTLDKVTSAIPAGDVAKFEQVNYVGGVVRNRVDAGGRLHTAVAFPAANGQNGKAFVVLDAVLKSKLTANSTSAYVNSFLSSNSAGGLLGVYVASSSAADTEKAITFAFNELKNIAGGSGDYTNAKNAKTFENLSALEKDSTSILLAASKEGLTPLEYADLRSVSNDDVKKAAASLLQSKPSYAAFGDTFGLLSYDGVNKLLK
eukprot:CAMPEP_0174818162 /NCGR_PEP_ID=MMETSP1107-20130205/791_1 /TAXON_ID=36770 /ORGANISM="Paraphysomonas vestita, Strain GFlagA" /LENGTH=417 /DNA_ID=CAMNT_0016029647 /DNA_START=80 /DNA_END=1333 /DNA_ORIENTATION=+